MLAHEKLWNIYKNKIDAIKKKREKQNKKVSEWANIGYRTLFSKLDKVRLSVQVSDVVKFMDTHGKEVSEQMPLAFPRAEEEEKFLEDVEKNKKKDGKILYKTVYK